KQIIWETQPPLLEADSQFLLEAAIEDDNFQNPTSGKLSPLLTGMKVGLAANSLVMGFSVYSLINASPAYSETDTLSKATQEYQTGDLPEAIALAKSIPSHSNVYPEAQATIEEWQEEWQVAAHQYQIAETALNEGRWSDVLYVASQV
ncbi:MAG: serine/threonine protein kinase, partial [Nostoc sp.]